MPLLPLDHPEPFAATLGIMLYPSLDETDTRKARAFAAQWLAEPLRQFYAEGHALSCEALARIAMDAGELEDLSERWWEATATGELIKTLLALAMTAPKLASWNNAAKLAELAASRAKTAGSRTAFWAAKTRFLSVAHLWGAWSVRNGKFTTERETAMDDFESFLVEAENLRRWGQTWTPPRKNGKPPLPANVWQTPNDWKPSRPRPNWCDRIMLPDLTVPDELLDKLVRAGRPPRR